MYGKLKKQCFTKLLLFLFGFVNLYASSNNNNVYSVSSIEEVTELTTSDTYNNKPFHKKNKDYLFVKIAQIEDSEEESDNKSYPLFKTSLLPQGFFSNYHIQYLETVICKRKEFIQYSKRFSSCICSRIYVLYQVFII